MPLISSASSFFCLKMPVFPGCVPIARLMRVRICTSHSAGRTVRRTALHLILSPGVLLRLIPVCYLSVYLFRHLITSERQELHLRLPITSRGIYYLCYVPTEQVPDGHSGTRVYIHDYRLLIVKINLKCCVLLLFFAVAIPIIRYGVVISMTES